MTTKVGHLRIWDLLTPQELDSFLVVIADRKVAQAVRDRDFRMLDILFNVSITTYEDFLMEQKAVVFANRPHNFEVRKAKVSILDVDDARTLT